MPTQCPEITTGDLHRQPKTPRARRPLSRMSEKNDKLSTKNREPPLRASVPPEDDEDSSAEHDDSDDGYSGESETDLDISDNPPSDEHDPEDIPKAYQRPRPHELASKPAAKLKTSRKDVQGPRRRKSPEPSIQYPTKTDSTWKYAVFLLAIVFATLLAVREKFLVTSDSLNVPTENEIKLRNFKQDIKELSMRFKHQDRSIWGDIGAGVSELVLQPDKPSILFFFSDDDYPMSCLANMVGNISRAAVGTPECLKLSASQLGNDYGEVIEKFRDEIAKHKIVIIENILDIHPEAMQAFHNLCDRITPLVSDVLYIFTMVAKGYDGTSALEFVENQLTKKMQGKMNVEKLDPLITRMTDSALIPVRPEPAMKTCPLRY